MTPQTTQSNLEIINEMQQQKFPGLKAMGQQDWDQLKSFFTDDVVYRPGALAEARGLQALVEHMDQIFSPVVVNAMDRKKTFELEDTVIIEYDMQITYVSDGKSVKFPCVDVYDFTNRKISGWRVYPMLSSMGVTPN